MKEINSVIILLLFIKLTIQSDVGQDIRSIFGDKDCIEGTLLSMGTLPFWESSAVSLDDMPLINTTTTTDDVVDKSATARIHEIAQFNKIKSHYVLVSEDGPAHSKLFKVSLVLGDENYVGEGASIKKAKTDAASLALEYTEYHIPPTKLPAIESGLKNSPTVQLNNAAQKLGVAVRYEVLDENKEKEESFGVSKPYAVESNKKSYLTRLNYSIHHQQGNNINVDSKMSGEPLVVRVHVGERNYLGIGHTVQAAKHDGATKAIEDIKRKALDEAKYCTTEGYEDQCKQNKENLKSPISLVYELSQKHQLGLHFEIIDEIGKPHEKTFVTQCKLGNLVAEGRGKTKKESKKRASENMLTKKSDLPPVSDLDNAVGVLEAKNKKKSKRKQKNVIRNQVDKLKIEATDMFSSVVEYFTPDNEMETDEKPVPKKGTSKEGGNRKSGVRKPRLTVKDELLQLSQANGIEVQINDLKNLNKYFTIVSLSTKPPHICLGEGPSGFKSQEKASLQALGLLHKLGVKVPAIDDLKVDSERVQFKEALETVELNFVEDDSDK